MVKGKSLGIFALVSGIGGLIAFFANVGGAYSVGKDLWNGWMTPPTRLETIWQGDWGSPEGYRFSFSAQLYVATDDDVEGKINWQLAATPGGHLADRVGSTATEYVRGSYDRKTKLMTVAGYEVSDPTLIITDTYRLQIKPDGISFVGMTLHHTGEWSAKTTGTVIVSEAR